MEVLVGTAIDSSTGEVEVVFASENGKSHLSATEADLASQRMIEQLMELLADNFKDQFMAVDLNGDVIEIALPDAGQSALLLMRNGVACQLDNLFRGFAQDEMGMNETEALSLLMQFRRFCAQQLEFRLIEM